MKEPVPSFRLETPPRRMDTPHFASALSTKVDSDAAIEEVSRALAAGLAGRKPDFAAVFVSHHHGTAIESLGPRLAQATGARVLIGCTGEGIVGTTQEIERGAAISLFGGTLPGTQLRPFVVQARREAEERLGFTKLPEVVDRSRAGVLLLADPFTFPAGEYLETLNSELPGVPVVGAMASGGNGPGQNLLVTGEGIVESGAIGVVVEGDVELRPVVSQGCRPVGKAWVITACKDNLIAKLGGKQAVQVLMETLRAISEEDRALLQNRPFLGLAVDPTKSDFGRGDFIVRMLVGIEPQQGAIAVGDNGMRVGQTVQFLVRDAASAGEDLTMLMRDRAGESFGAMTEQSARGALLFSCNGRGTRMFSKPNHDIGCVQSAFAQVVPASGFFAMGEIGPVGGRNFLHGFTASVALFQARQ
jgi:small ligand-binding sensory domain FIST